MLVDLKSNSPPQQAKAIIEVIELEIDEAIPVIIKWLQSPDTMVHFYDYFHTSRHLSWWFWDKN